ncbi:hypothetical protein GH733_017565 [Mirounga leonina]|nr:hypothetical protein GH733_017565 [Mirounga leonina]
MNDIKACYQKLYGLSLCQAILDETKGDYEKILDEEELRNVEQMAHHTADKQSTSRNNYFAFI